MRLFIALLPLLLLSFYSADVKATVEMPGGDLHKYMSSFDISLSAKADTLPGCANTWEDASVIIKNNSTSFIKNIPIKHIIGSDTNEYRLWLNLDSGGTRIFNIRNEMPDTSGLILVQLIFDSTDAVVSNNAVAFTFNVSNELKASFTVNNICNGDTARFINTTSYIGKDSIRYEWQLTPDTIYRNKHVKRRYYNSTVTHQILSWWIHMSATSSKCTSFASKSVLTYPNLKVDFAFKKNGKALKILNTMQMDTTAYHYYWDFGDGNYSTDRLTTHTYAVDSQYRICLTVTTKDSVCRSSGCKLTGPLSNVKGRAFIDVNGNCKYDSTDKPIYTSVYANKRGLIQYSDTSGNYDLELFSHEDYVIKTDTIPGLNLVCNSDSFFIKNASPYSTYTHDFIYEAITYDLKLSASTDTVVACHAQQYSRTVTITNNTPVFFKDLPVKLISGVDTTSFKKVINLEPGKSSQVTFDSISLPDTSGLFQIKILYDVSDDTISNNTVLLSFRISNDLKADFTADSNICGKGKVSFINTTTNNGPDSVSYIWEPGNGEMYTTKNLQVLLLNTDPNRTRPIFASLKAITSRCTSTVVKKIEIFPIPYVNFTCKRTGKELQVLTLNLSDSTSSFQWEFGDGSRSIDSLPNYQYANSDNYVVTLKVKNRFGCSYSKKKLTAPTSYVTGRSYLDINLNCIYDSKDIPIQTRVTADRWMQFTNYNGEFNLAVQSDKSYTVKSERISNFKLSCNSESFSINSAKEDSSYLHDFIYILDTSKTDFGLSLGNNAVIRGQTSRVNILVSAYSIPKSDSFTIEFTHNSNQVIKYTNTPYTPISTGKVLFKIKRPTINNRAFISITLEDPLGKLAFGDRVVYKCRFTTHDDIVQNDMDSSSAIVRAPFDPNAKTSYPEGAMLEPINKVRYLVQFQNIGTVAAKDVVVYDVLDSLLPSTSIEVTGTSHPDQFKMDITNNVVKWSFQDIYLPDSASDPIGSQGYIMFEADVAPGFKSVGDSIHNKAIIYFDFEDGIETNITSIYIIDEPASSNNFDKEIKHLIAFPNPTHTVLNVRNLSANAKNITVLNANGMLMGALQINSFERGIIDTSGYAAGLYFLQDEAGNSIKFLVIKN